MIEKKLTLKEILDVIYHKRYDHVLNGVVNLRQTELEQKLEDNNRLNRLVDYLIKIIKENWPEEKTEEEKPKFEWLPDKSWDYREESFKIKGRIFKINPTYVMYYYNDSKIIIAKKSIKRSKELKHFSADSFEVDNEYFTEIL